MPTRITVFALVAFLGSGCSCAPPECTEDGGCLPDGSIVLPERDGGADARDAEPRTDPPTLPGCGSVGTVGGHCRGGAAGSCGVGECGPPLMATGGGELTLRAGFGFEQGTAPDPTTGFSTVAASQDDALDIPLVARTGSMCVVACDLGATTDSCGTCATCNGTIGIGLLAPQNFYAAGTAPFDDDTGWCRADCEFDPATAGATCPTATTATSNDAYTCSPLSNTCIEGCVSDNECRFELVTTREGLVVSFIDPTRADVCSPITHRCEWTNPDTETVGDPCASSRDCAEDVGLCLRGGTCAELECATAADTGANMICDGGAGVCLGNGGNRASICVQGCTTASDCNAGSTCIPLGATVGTFTGYCLGICDERADDPDGLAGPMTSADDDLFACDTGRGERCDHPLPTAEDLDPTGSCRPTCTVDGDCAGAEGNHCELVPGETFGFCRWLGQVCSADDLDADCHGAQVCDLLAWPEELGLCVDACAVAGDCGSGEVCTPRGVCRTACVAGGAPCPAGQACLGTAADGTYCEQEVAP